VARVWDKSVFHTEDLFPGADKFTRKSLGMLNRENKSVAKIKEAASLAGIRSIAPFWQKDCWAHLAFPNLRVVLCVRPTLDSVFAANMRAKWLAHKYKMLLVAERNIERLTVEEVAAELRDALKKMGKVK
jgi:hypothetical protein